MRKITRILTSAMVTISFLTVFAIPSQAAEVKVSPSIVSDSKVEDSVIQDLLSGTFIEVLNVDKQDIPGMMAVQYLSAETVTTIIDQEEAEKQRIEQEKAKTEAERIRQINEKRNEIVNTATVLLGRRYVWGAEGPKTFDCSGLVQYVFGKNGFSLNCTASTQVKHGVKVSRSELQPADLIFFTGPGCNGIAHIGIYIGDNKFIHAARGAGKVIISELKGYYSENFTAARRLI